MNYKKERLVKTAIPTLQRTKDGTMSECRTDEKILAKLAYDFNDKGFDHKSIDLPQQQLMPSINLKQEINESQTKTYDTVILNEWNNLSPSNQKPKTIKAYEAKPAVLNRECAKVVKRFAVKNIQEKSFVKRSKISCGENDATNRINKQSEKPDRSPIEDVIISAKTYGKSNSVNSFVFQELDVDPMDDESSVTAENSSNATSTDEQQQDSDVVGKALYLQMMSEHAKQIEELKKIITDKLADKKDDSNNSNASQSTNDLRQIRVEKGPAMTKVQLFNGIRKYLNPTMVALLRMEMFGSSEREYRPDEKQLSKELYNLNQNVYDYMRDEWRFRLPPKLDVEAWLKNPDDDETWELC